MNSMGFSDDSTRNEYGWLLINMQVEIFRQLIHTEQIR
ncbi:hypothetical protein TRICHSKD4_2083 [Roseibium sp. TrichSKD4]|nr:hypothetical protein TRICHSKD4_2083 [Roseibium sp. TrichSKD4]